MIGEKNSRVWVDKSHFCLGNINQMIGEKNSRSWVDKSHFCLGKGD